MGGPLSGIRVFDLGHAAVGAWAGMLLGALGADVIKVEGPQGDVSLNNQPRQRGVGTIYITNNANKRAITLDLRDLRQRHAAYQLIKHCDVLIENFSPGTVERLGLGYEKVARINPRIVYCSANAFGSKGPLGGFRAYDPIVQAFSGFVSLNGTEGGRPEFFRQVGHIDKTVASYVLSGILRGLIARELTGVGQKIEVTMLGGALSLQVTRVSEYFLTGVCPAPMASACPSTAPHEAFYCEDSKYIAVGVINESQWACLCRAIGLPELASDARFATNPERVKNRTTLQKVLADRFKTRPLRWWEIQLTKVGVPNGRFLDIDDLLYHSHALENEAIVTLETRHYGRIYSGGLPWRFDHTPLDPIRGACKPGEFTGEVLRQFGVDPQTFKRRAVKGTSSVIDGRRSA